MQDDRSNALMDEAIARQIDTALAVEPSPEFLARVRTAVASEPVAARGWFTWPVMAAAVVLLAIGVAAVMNRPEPTPVASSEVHGLGAVREPSLRDLSPVPAGAPAIELRKPDQRPVEAVREPPLQPVVLIPGAERAALRRLLRSGIPDATFELSPATAEITQPVETSPTFDEITILPIAIEPLPPVGPPQGESQ